MRFAMLFEPWFNLPPDDFKVMASLMLSRNAESGYTKAYTTKELLELTGLGRSSMFRALARLVSAGVIERVGLGGRERVFYIEIPVPPVGLCTGGQSHQWDSTVPPVGLYSPTSGTTILIDRQYRQYIPGEAMPYHKLDGVYAVSKDAADDRLPRDKKPDQQTSPGVKSKARTPNYLVDGEKLAGHLMVRTKRAMDKSTASMMRWGKFAQKWGFDEGIAIIDACIANSHLTDFMGDGQMAMNFAKVNYYAENYWKVEKAGPALNEKFM